jgi:hypothetical protein
VMLSKMCKYIATQPEQSRVQALRLPVPFTGSILLGLFPPMARRVGSEVRRDFALEHVVWRDFCEVSSSSFLLFSSSHCEEVPLPRKILGARDASPNTIQKIQALVCYRVALHPWYVDEMSTRFRPETFGPPLITASGGEI